MEFTNIHKQSNFENCFFIERRKILMEVPLRMRSPEELLAYRQGWENGIKWARTHHSNPLVDAAICSEQSLGHAS